MLRYVLIVVLSVLGPLGPALASDSSDFAALLNRERAAQGLQGVQPDPALAAIAGGHASDMAAGNFMSHQGSDGSDLGDRLRRAGYCYRAANENVAMGYRDGAHVLSGWMSSAGHRRNALSRDVTHFGFAQVARSHVLVMARPC